MSVTQVACLLLGAESGRCLKKAGAFSYSLFSLAQNIFVPLILILAGHAGSICYADQCGSIKIRFQELIQHVAQ